MGDPSILLESNFSTNCEFSYRRFYRLRSFLDVPYQPPTIATAIPAAAMTRTIVADCEAKETDLNTTSTVNCPKDPYPSKSRPVPLS